MCVIANSLVARFSSDKPRRGRFLTEVLQMLELVEIV